MNNEDAATNVEINMSDCDVSDDLHGDWKAYLNMPLVFRSTRRRTIFVSVDLYSCR